MKPEHNDQPLEPLIGANVAAEILGFSALTVRRMAHDGRLPSYAFPRGKDKNGNEKYLFRYKASELNDYLDSLRRKPVQNELAPENCLQRAS
jgi:excisionase family DNA binding protein